MSGEVDNTGGGILLLMEVEKLLLELRKPFPLGKNTFELAIEIPEFIFFFHHFD